MGRCIEQKAKTGKDEIISIVLAVYHKKKVSKIVTDAEVENDAFKHFIWVFRGTGGGDSGLILHVVWLLVNTGFWVTDFGSVGAFGKPLARAF